MILQPINWKDISSRCLFSKILNKNFLYIFYFILYFCLFVSNESQNGKNRSGPVWEMTPRPEVLSNIKLGKKILEIVGIFWEFEMKIR